MSHDLTIRKNGRAEMFSGNNITPWHGLGTVVEGKLTAAAAIEAAGLDWEVEQVPVYAGSEYTEVPNQFCIRRKDNNLPLAILGSRYCPIQNSEAFEFFDEIIGHGQAYYETAGSLRGGKRIWIMATLPGKLFLETKPEDETEKKVLLYTAHDGTAGIWMQLIGNRVVCQNTLSVALRTATNQIKVRHTKNYKQRIDVAAKAIGMAHAYFDDLQHVMNVLSKQQMSKSEAESFVEKLIPTSKEEPSTRTANKRVEVLNLFQSGVGNAGRTAYDMLNAVTELVDHHNDGRITKVRTAQAGADNVKAENRFERNILGTGTGTMFKQRATNMLMTAYGN